MVGIIGIVALLVVLVLSLVITRLATIALTMTGLSEESARFQARSAFTGTGFTTGESESIVNHPVRRRIIMLLMITHSAGLISIILSLILSFGGAMQNPGSLLRLLWLVPGAVALWVLARSRLVNLFLGRVMRWALRRWTNLEVRDYVGLLNLSGDYAVMELHVRAGDWLAGQSLVDSRLSDEGVQVLGVYRQDGSYVGVPRAQTRIRAGDRLIAYGRSGTLSELDQRPSGPEGQQAHERAVTAQRQWLRSHEHEDLPPPAAATGAADRPAQEP